MDSGLIQILVIAFFVIISMMDGAARKKRKENERLGREGRSDGMPEAGELFPQEPETTSEGMVPHELWEEIAALAKGEPSPSARQLPQTATPSPTPDIESTSVLMDGYESEETRLDPIHQHVEAHDHVEWEPDDGSGLKTATIAPRERVLTEPGEGLPAVDLDRKPARTRRSVGPAEAVRRTLTGGGHDSIRQAVILSEVLGPPVALRESDHKPPG